MELYVLGAGCAFPTAALDNELVGALLAAGPTEQDSAIVTRASTLPPEYIAASGNVDVSAVPSRAGESPTDLAVRACRAALERSGLKAEEIGLLIADCATPWQTIPAEAARIGDKLGLKLPAYDVCGSGAPFSFLLQTLNSWKEERVPDVVLIVSTNTPVQRINYRQGPAGWYFGDGAAALLISRREGGRLKVAAVQHRDTSRAAVELGVYGELRLNVAEALQMMRDAACEIAGTLRARLGAADTAWIGPQFHAGLAAHVWEAAGVDPAASWHNFERRGNSLGSAAAAVLAEKWDEIRPGQQVAMIECGPARGRGYTLFSA